jgi:hypothetical protein
VKKVAIPIVVGLMLVYFFYLCGEEWRQHQETVNKLKAATAVLDSVRARDARIEDMAETLVRSYGLDTIHAHYYSVIFDDYSSAYSIPWVVFGAVMRMESNFVSTAKSDRGCKGLMQLKEGTMQQMCAKLGIRYKDDVTIWDDFSNMVCGMAYLHLTAKNKGIDAAINAYVGGTDYMRTISVAQDVKMYVVEYNSSITREIDRLELAYAGIRANKGRK